MTGYEGGTEVERGRGEMRSPRWVSDAISCESLQAARRTLLTVLQGMDRGTVSTGARATGIRRDRPRFGRETSGSGRGWGGRDEGATHSRARVRIALTSSLLGWKGMMGWIWWRIRREASERGECRRPRDGGVTQNGGGEGWEEEGSG